MASSVLLHTSAQAMVPDSLTVLHRAHRSMARSLKARPSFVSIVHLGESCSRWSHTFCLLGTPGQSPSAERAHNSHEFASVERLVDNSRERSVVVHGGRSVHFETSDDFVLMEPGEEEVFVSEEELRVCLRKRLEECPFALTEDLRIFPEREDAVTHLITSACELPLGGGNGSVQWFKVRL
eukprot:TRINITY_DN3233_c0_g1_i1.p1 TRINITY_DN3233_c0_g1~~TRINITY_DN3233_c0_g1_i1.p1  ORF type:complete len:181 (+),score=4.76 TRINITY_DN3233_c0_g1_i1:309-851(+)